MITLNKSLLTFRLLIASSTPLSQASCCNHFYHFPVLTNYHESSPKDRVDIFVVVSKVRDLVMLVVCYWLSWALPEPPVICGCWLLVTVTSWGTEYSKSTLTSQFPTPEQEGSPKFPMNLDTLGPPSPPLPTSNSKLFLQLTCSLATWLPGEGRLRSCTPGPCQTGGPVRNKHWQSAQQLSNM